MFKKTIFLFALFFLISNCGGTWDSVKRGITGQKNTSTDEFLVQKKAPLILPPDYESLPTPSNNSIDDETESFDKTLIITSTESDTDFSSSGSAEESILNQIRKK